MGWAKSFFEVDLNRLKSPDLGDDWQSPKGYQRQEIEQMVHQLGEVQALSHDRGLTYDNFARMRTSADPDERALGETHHKFYDHAVQGVGTNHEYIRLSSVDNAYEIQNGHHRVHAAKELGLRTVPAEVTAPEEQMQKCRGEGFQTPLLSPQDRQPDRRSVQEPADPNLGSQQEIAETPLLERGASGNRNRKERLDR